MDTPLDYNDFKRGLEFTLKWEGGYVNNANDPGGETKWGISKRSYPTLDIANLEPAQAAEIYYRDFWQRSGCSGLVFPFNCVLFDTSVNVGVSRAVSWARDCKDVQSLLDRRRNYYISLAKQNPKFSVFLKGWLARVSDLQKFVEVNSVS